MDRLKIYSQTDLTELISYREGETKLGECVQLVASLDDLAASSAKFVLLGIPEDIGIRANHGIAGAATAWHPALKALMNIQSTGFLRGEELLVLGHFDIADPADTSIKGLEQKVQQIDELVYPVIRKIVAGGKIPIVIGGGHNNAYPIIKGTATALKRAIDVINIDAHADLRPASGRHSGNGFSHALAQGLLNNYGLFGLHQNYNNTHILEAIVGNPNIHAVFFDDMLQSPQPPAAFWTDLLKHMDAAPGLEIDLDCIANILSSAMTPSGFSLNEIRRLLLTPLKKFSYLHICEGAVTLIDGRQAQTTAKAIAYLISDFIKSQQ
ncbi:formimidoylglutamase [Pedobacter africanus]|uniref:Formiminoglutamase n=1 Tax=Pedobacter africanus TaxID=151894 RepID=A0A1W2B8K2_9SPHI|nr:formimidoylglutamase [Pedobacter africanus]SMC69315.1 formiminoglutamase [Pedobacter africanus]